MYGTVAQLHVKAEHLERLRALAAAEESIPIDGYLGSTLLRCDNHPDTVILVARFRDKESYDANADSPEQDARYREMRALMEDDPVWFDGEWLALE